MDSLNYVEARAEDIGAVSDLIHEMAKFEKLEDDVTFSPDTLKDEIFYKKAATFLFIKLGDQLIGYIAYFFSFSTFKGHRSLYLEDLYIKPEYRKRGFGRKAFGKIAEVAKENGCERIDWVCLEWNENAKAFYKSLGADPHEEWLLFRLEKDGIEKLSEKK